MVDGKYIATSRSLSQIPFVDRLLGGQVSYYRSRVSSHDLVCPLVGWGRRPSAQAALNLAHERRLEYFTLEDGFLRSFNTGNLSPPLALVKDKKGIYFDSTCLSDLEVLLSGPSDVLASVAPEVAHACREVLKHGLSKYNHSPDVKHDIFFPIRSDVVVDGGERSAESVIRRVLLVDQTAGDMGVSFGGADERNFWSMLNAALVENPEATIYIKTHPEVTSGRKSGYLTCTKADNRVVVLRDAINPLSLLEHIDKVYVVTSTMGFEALLAGKPVVCFGVPWYAGWGVTDDRCKDSPAWARRTRKRSVDELFAAAYIHYTRYLDPVTHKRGTIMDVIHWLIRQKEMANRMHGKSRTGRVIGIGFRRWKAANIKPLLGLHSSQVFFTPSVKAARNFSLCPGDSLVVWGATLPTGLHELASDSGAKVLHAEDGFIRSVGLGSDLIRPQSLVLDERGIYFDATRESELEHMLNTENFIEEELLTARKVRGFIVEHGITKYNLEPRVSVNWPAAGRRILLVPGQVEDDASIRFGCTSVKTNLGLLEAVRSTNPEAFIVYKPHPDVVSMNRRGRLAADVAKRFADQVETNVSVISCIEAADEVHTMTSLSGFDALLRGKKVVTYGQPFYAGWGLTTDLAENPVAFARRIRTLSLDELVAGALLRYPIYWDWELRGYTTCEAVLHRIVEQRAAREKNGSLDKLRVGFVRRQFRKARLLTLAWLDGIGVRHRGFR